MGRDFHAPALDAPSSAGSSYVTLMVTSLNDQPAVLSAAAIPVGPTQGTPGLAKVATVTDAEGNRIIFAENLTDKY